jgi:hypothetical protein
LRDAAVHEAGHAVAIWWHVRRRAVVDNWTIEAVAVKRQRRRPFVVRGLHRPNSRGVIFYRPLLRLDQDCAAIGDKPYRRWVLRCRLAELATVYAGPIAEARNAGDGWLDELDWCLSVDDPESCTDLQLVEGTIPKLGRRWRRHLDRAWTRAGGIVDGHWPQINLVARTLERHGEIDGETAFQICDRAGRALPIGSRP